MPQTEANSALLEQAINELGDCSLSPDLFHRHCNGNPLPSWPALEEVIDLCQAILFPGYYGDATVTCATMSYHIGVSVHRLFDVLCEQIAAVLSNYSDPNQDLYGTGLRARAAELSATLIGRLSDIRRILSTDVEAAYLSDPAVDSKDEIISSYPVIKALVNYRVAHELHRLNVPLLPRLLTEMAHATTGIDIHPAAEIGEYFTIDHGTGVVIGATCIIGHHVKLYQGVTLGAKSFPLDENGNPIKGIPRHPILGNHVVVYSNSSILGRITIGDNVTVGGNVWLTHDVPPNTLVRQNLPDTHATSLE